MVRVSISRTRAGIPYRLQLSGHASTLRGTSSPDEYDLICAAVSAIAQSAVIGIEEHLRLEPEVEIREGFLSCRLPDDWDPRMRGRAGDILAAAWHGLRAIALQYPEHVSIMDDTQEA